MNLQFKSSKRTDLLENIITRLELILAEQRHQRSDLNTLRRMFTKLHNDLKLQKQVDDYYDSQETSPQTDYEEHLRHEMEDK